VKAPFPWFGGKSRVADLVWARFGVVNNYVEPFAGSLAVLLGAPDGDRTETVNDADGFVSNFWRAVSADPEGVARFADWPVNENDLHARHVWLVAQREEFTAKLCGDPDYFDVKVAGYWVWGLCSWIGSGWCSGNGPWHVVDSKLVLGNKGQGINRKLPHLGNKGQGINRQLPHLGDKGQGINRKLPHLGDKGQGINRKLPHLGDKGRGILDMMLELQARLRGVRVACGDWTRVVGPSVTWRHGTTAVLLDPPYDDSRTADVYAIDSTTIAADVAKWCRENGDNPKLRIALCGYEGSFDAPAGWETVEWKAQGGFGNQSDGDGRANARRERVWFSPACLAVEETQMQLAAGVR
jgi:hypothetical protein